MGFWDLAEVPVGEPVGAPVVGDTLGLPLDTVGASVVGLPVGDAVGE